MLLADRCPYTDLCMKEMLARSVSCAGSSHARWKGLVKNLKGQRRVLSSPLRAVRGSGQALQIPMRSATRSAGRAEPATPAVRISLSMASSPWPWELTGGSLQMYVLGWEPAVPFVPAAQGG